MKKAVLAGRLHILLQRYHLKRPKARNVKSVNRGRIVYNP